VHQLRSVASGLLLLAPLACSGLSLPEGPELAELDAAYDAPEGTVDDETIAALADLSLSRLDAILGIGRLDFVTESLTDVAEVVQETAQGEGETRFQLKAVASVERQCPGDGSDPDGDGLLTYTMRVNENDVLDTVWGDFDRCRFPDTGETFPGASVLPRSEGAIVTYDGSMDVYLGGNLHLSDLSFRRFLFRLQGELELETETVAVDFDFRIHTDKRTEIRIPADGGDVVFGFTPGTTDVRLEAGDGSYCCDFAEHFCVLAEGNDCDALETGDQVLRW